MSLLNYIIIALVIILIIFIVIRLKTPPKTTSNNQYLAPDGTSLVDGNIPYNAVTNPSIGD